MRTPVEKALWFIESHLSCDISLEELACVCALSRSQMSRLFSHEIGMSITAYARSRRLSVAARTLVSGAPDILSVALDAGYGSHEAFSRAFRDHFGLSPADLREQGHLGCVTLVEPMREDRRVRVQLPPPRFEEPGPLRIVGIGRRFADHDFAGIPALWRDLRPHLGQIPKQTGGAAYGIVADHGRGQSGYLYVAGVEVSDFSELGRGFTTLRLPARRWAVFPHPGHVTSITSTIEAIFSDALPKTDLAASDTPDVLERYGDAFEPRTGRGGFEIWVPLK